MSHYKKLSRVELLMKLNLIAMGCHPLLYGITPATRHKSTSALITARGRYSIYPPLTVDGRKAELN